MATLFGARKAGASGWGVAGAGLGMLVGISFGLPGFIVGPAVGRVRFELCGIPTCAGRLGRARRLFGFLLGIVAIVVRHADRRHRRLRLPF